MRFLLYCIAAANGGLLLYRIETAAPQTALQTALHLLSLVAIGFSCWVAGYISTPKEPK